MAAAGTGVVDYNSPLIRSKWMAEGLVGTAAKSFWAPYIGKTSNSIIMQKNDITADKSGKTVVFDFDGYLVKGPVKGKTTAFGKGEEKRKFSDTLTIERYRFPVDNGDAFDGIEIGDLSITQHNDSRTKLADKWVKFKDQAIFDAAQQQVTHIIQSSTFGFDDFLDMENIVKTGRGYTVGGRRMPLQPFYTADNKPIWLMVIDSTLKTKLLKSSGAQAVFKDADVMGNNNRLFSGVIGKIGNFVVVEADTFFGVQSGNIITDLYADMSNVAELQGAGLRQYVDNGTTQFTPVKWTGDAGFYTATGNLYSRGLILGAGAMQQAFGRMPDYKYQESEDFGIKSESLLEVWCNTRTTSLTVENLDYDTGIGGISNGSVAFDIKI